MPRSLRYLIAICCLCWSVTKAFGVSGNCHSLSWHEDIDLQNNLDDSTVFSALQEENISICELRYTIESSCKIIHEKNVDTETEIPSDSLRRESIDSDHLANKKKSFFPVVMKGIKRFIGEFNTFDTLYIEPQHYKFQVMWQITNSFEQFRLKTGKGNHVDFSPDVNTRMGPYIGYSLIFLGYTLQLNNLYIGNTKKSFNLSLYTALVGLDFYYRDNKKFKIREIFENNKEIVLPQDVYENIFDGSHVKYWGFNTYYIFNHRRHSYPAAYNQSTCQKHSSGSPLAGFGYGKYDISMDWEKLKDFIPKDVGGKTETSDSSSGIFGSNNYFDNLEYESYSLYGGYSYNWVFAKNWLLGTSATLALTYNKSSGENKINNNFFDDFKFSNMIIDGVGRIGVVWNNTRLFAGAVAQIHSYNYSKEHFSVNNIFGNLNFYVGFNIGKKRKYRSQGKWFEF